MHFVDFLFATPIDFKILTMKIFRFCHTEIGRGTKTTRDGNAEKA